jgi:hypothetical protein
MFWMKSNGANYGEGHVYDQDGLQSVHNHEFMAEPAFCQAYERGVRAAGTDYSWHWRVHVGLWVAAQASKLEGDFVECGVNHGFLSSAIMDFLRWDGLGKRFYLLDTFSGLDPRFLTDEEKLAGALENNRVRLAEGHYVRGADAARANFAQWKNVQIIEGSVPETLPEVRAPRIAYLHIDMNCSQPEVAAAEFFWDRLVSGAFILLDDYAYHGYHSQKVAMDGFALAHGTSILSLPTGQGLMIRVGATQESA